MRKKLALLLAMAICLSSAACSGRDQAVTPVLDGQEAGEIPSVNEETLETGQDADAPEAEQGTDGPEAEQGAEAGTADAEEDGMSSGFQADALTESFEFTKGADDKDLEKPITAYALKFNDSGVVESGTDGDIKNEYGLDQTRDGLHLHISILGKNYSIDEYMAKTREDNLRYVTDISRRHNIQTADADSADGSAKFTAVRYTNFEDGGENDYEYMGKLAYTDGASVAAVEFIYSVDREYGNGEEVEAWMKAVLECYGIDYGGLEWNAQ